MGWRSKSDGNTQKNRGSAGGGRVKVVCRDCEDGVVRARRAGARATDVEPCKHCGGKGWYWGPPA